MSWQLCLFLRPLRFILQVLRSRNSSQRYRSTHFALGGGGGQLAATSFFFFFSQFLLDFPQHKEASRVLSTLLLRRSQRVTSLSLPVSAQRRHPTQLHLLPARRVLADIFSARAPGWFYSLPVPRRLLCANPRVIPTSA